jgi:hypothetical protein
MKHRYLFTLLVFLGVSITGCVLNPTTDYNRMFSMPRTPHTLLGPGQEFTMAVPEGKKVVITDVYIENRGDGSSHVLILEQRLPNSREIRYAFNTESKKVTNVSFTTGLRLGEEHPIAGKIIIKNIEDSEAGVLPRLNGFFVD